MQGYLFVSVMLNETSELNKLILQAIKIDLASRNELEVSLALNCLANIGGKEFAPSVVKDVLRLLVAQFAFSHSCRFFIATRDAPRYVRKKAALCSLRFFRRASDEFPHGEFGGRVVQMLSHQDLVRGRMHLGFLTPPQGLLTSVLSLITSMAQRDSIEFKDAVSLAITKLHRVCAI